VPFKTFANNDVLTAREVNLFMMNQQIMVFADATARDAAIVSPVHGMTVFLKSANRLSFYNGSSWRLV